MKAKDDMFVLQGVNIARVELVTTYVESVIRRALNISCSLTYFTPRAWNVGFRYLALFLIAVDCLNFALLTILFYDTCWRTNWQQSEYDYMLCFSLTVVHSIFC